MIVKVECSINVIFIVKFGIVYLLELKLNELLFHCIALGSKLI